MMLTSGEEVAQPQHMSETLRTLSWATRDMAQI
jgi:hypothetical protein